MGRKLFTIAAVTFLVVPLVGCRVDQTEEGEMPDVDVEAQGGQMPEYDVETPDVDVETEPLEVPTGIDVEYPDEGEEAMEEEAEETEEAADEMEEVEDEQDPDLG